MIAIIKLIGIVNTIKTVYQLWRLKTEVEGMLKNWKTSLFGSGGILTAIFDIASNFNAGTPEKINWSVDIPIILAGIGLLFAKDGNVTGGTVAQ